MSKLYALAVLALLACGCGAGPPTAATDGTAHAGERTVRPLPAEKVGGTLRLCSEIFQAGRPTPAAARSVTCMGSEGGPVINPAIPCKDGGALWQVGGSGADGWGRAGEPFHQTTDLQDPGWLAALAECTGG